MAEKSEESIEDLSSQFDASFNVTKKLNDVQKPHPRYALYKSKGTTGLQEKRRQKLLEDQKKRRDDFLLIAREIASGDIENDESFEDQDDFFDEEDEIESMDVCGKYRLRKRFKNQLMESEWLVDIPKDLDKNYILVPVPEGRRAFIITGYGETYHYSRSGFYINKFPSLLPGGSRRNKHTITFLDCIYVELEKTYYVLDVMIWNDFSYHDCETDCRRFMLKSRFQDTPELSQVSTINPYMFKILPDFSCDPESMSKALKSDFLFDPNPLDGVLFYNKNVHYLPGTTPLVGWLKGYMVPELLGVEVSQKLMAQRPNSYANMSNYIESYTEERKKKNEKHSSNKIDDI